MKILMAVLTRRDAVHFCAAATAIDQAAAEVIGFVADLLFPAHDLLYLIKQRAIDDLRYCAFDADCIGTFPPLCTGFRHLCTIDIHACILFVVKHLIDLRITHRAPAFAHDAISLHLGYDIHIADTVGAGVEELAHVGSFQLIDNIFTRNHIIPKWRDTAVMQRLKGVFTVAFFDLIREIVDIVLRQRPHERAHNLCFVTGTKILRGGDELYAFALQARGEVNMLGHAASNTIILMHEDDGELTFITIPLELLVLGAAGGFTALAADGLIFVNTNDCIALCLRVSITGAKLGFDTIFGLLIAGIAGVDDRVLDGCRWYGIVWEHYLITSVYIVLAGITARL